MAEFDELSRRITAVNNARELIKELIFSLVFDIPLGVPFRSKMSLVELQDVPSVMRDIVQMFQNMNPHLEQDAREEMKAALVDLLSKGGGS